MNKSTDISTGTPFYTAIENYTAKAHFLIIPRLCIKVCNIISMFLLILTQTKSLLRHLSAEKGLK